MEATMMRLLQFRREHNRTPTIRELRSMKVVTREETQDAWGNNFVVNASTGTLFAPGRDGIEGTEDDFEFYRGGRPPRIPEPLDADSLAINKGINNQ
jgi:hypothetical protein